MNDEIRKAAKIANVRLWQVAEEIGISDFTLSRRLRHELPQKEKVEMLKAIQSVAARQGG